MYESWKHKQEKEQEIQKNLAIFTGYFSNPQLAHKYVEDMNPTAESNPEEFEESWNMVLEDRAKWEKTQKRRRKKHIIKD